MFETFESLPESTTTVRSGKYGPYNQTKREAVTNWPLGESTADEEGGTVLLSLRTSHHADTKSFRSYLTWETKRPVDPDSVFSVSTWSSEHHLITVYAEKCPRYSQKAMEAAHAEALARMEIHFDEGGQPFVVAQQALSMSGIAETV